MVMVSDLFKALGCFAVAFACFAAPEWLPVVVESEAPCSDECVHPEDEFCSGATPDCPSHWECWNSLPPAY